MSNSKHNDLTPALDSGSAPTSIRGHVRREKGRGKTKKEGGCGLAGVYTQATPPGLLLPRGKRILAGQFNPALTCGAGFVHRKEDGPDDDRADEPEDQDQAHVAEPFLAAPAAVIGVVV